MKWNLAYYCVYCDSDEHEANNCSSTSPTERKEILMRKKMSFNCAAGQQRANACKSKKSCRPEPQATSHVNLPNSRVAGSENQRLKHESTRYLVSRSFSLSEINLYNRGFGADQLPEVPSPIAAQATRMCRLRWQTLHERHEAGCNLDGSDLKTKVCEYDVSTKERASRFASDGMGSPWAGLLAGNATADYEQLCALDVLDLADSPTGDQREVYREFREQLTRDRRGGWSPSAPE